MESKRLYGLIGYPLGHSFSKQYFTEKFLKEGLADCSFEAFPIESVELFPQLLAEQPLLKGLSVTIPYKEQVLRFVHEQSDAVKAIGATNSIRIRNGHLTAYNTDIVGFEKTFSRLLQPHHVKALVLGTGGASKAVQYVLAQKGIAFNIVSRKAGAGVITYDSLTKALMEEHTVVINCSPAGMYPNEQECPAIPYQYLSPDHYLYDLVYRPAETRFLLEGKQRGAAVQNGYEMLLLQAEESWRIWNEA